MQPARWMLLWGVIGVASAVSGEAGQRRPPDAFYVPSAQSVADAMLQLAAVTPADVVYDLGSGDGRIVILAAQKYGARGVGVEIDPALVSRARAIAREGGVADRVRFVEGDLFDADVSEATVVTLYLSTLATRRLAEKLRRELRPGARIVSQQFEFGTWEPDVRELHEGAQLFLWRVPAPRARDGDVSARPHVSSPQERWRARQGSNPLAAADG